MRWSDPKYFWTQFLPALLLIGWVLADKARRRRLHAFGDPVIMGVPRRLARSAIALGLQVLGFAAASAVLPMPEKEHKRERLRPTLIEIVLDARLFDASTSEGPSPLDAAEYQVRAVLQTAGSAHFALYKAANPIELLVPATSDAQGLLIVMGRMRLAKQGGDRAQLSESVRALTKRESADASWRRKMVVISREAPEDRAWSSSAAEDGPSLLWVRLAAEDRRPGASAADKQASWIWSDDGTGLREFLAEGRPQEPETGGRPAGLTIVQSLACLGFVVLLGEVFLGSFERARAEGGFGG